MIIRPYNIYEPATYRSHFFILTCLLHLFIFVVVLLLLFSYIFFQSREVFCQLVQQMKNQHSSCETVDHISVFIGTWNMGMFIKHHAIFLFIL